MAHNVIDISNYIINYSIEIKKPISNLKLQKLLYYTQAAFLVKFNKPCFNEAIIAWEYGPVVREAYDRYKIYGRSDIPTQDKEKNMVFDFDTAKILMKENEISINFLEQAILEKVVDSYKNINNPFDLVKKTHAEDPWRETKQGDEITIKKIREYYSRNIQKIYS